MTDSWNPNQYQKFKYERSQPFFDLLNLVQPKSQMDIIDLGCGTGELTEMMHAKLHAKSTLGTDNSKAMLEKAKNFATANLTFVEQNITSFNASAQYDLIFANASIQWCPDHPELFRQLRNGLRPGGQLAIQMPMNHDYPTHTIAYDLATEWKHAGKLSEEPRAPTLLSPEQYAQILYELKFKEQSVNLKVYTHILESREAVIEWVRGTLLTYYQSVLSPSDFGRFVAEFRERLFTVLPDKRPFFYPFKRILIWGFLT